jgi:uncharacterized repeat protein (TIGR01451 family)
MSVPYDAGTLPVFYKYDRHPLRSGNSANCMVTVSELPSQLAIFLTTSMFLSLHWCVYNCPRTCCQVDDLYTHSRCITDTASQYPFGYGLSYTTFSQDLQSAAPSFEGRKKGTFAHGDTIAFSVSVRNNGKVDGSHVPQVSSTAQALSSSAALVSFSFSPASYGEVDLPPAASGIVCHNG